jgi:hypothetical protein
MMTRSRLVYVPALPWDAETLLPQHRLAALAGALQAAGHEATILDWGTLGGLERLACVAGLGPDRDAPESRARTPWGRSAVVRRRAAALEAALEARAVEVGRAVLGVSRPELVVFLIQRPLDVAEARRVARRLREWAPEVVQVVTGAHVDAHATTLMQGGDFDVALIGEAELGLLGLAAAWGQRSAWGRIPNLVTRDARGYAGGHAESAPDWTGMGTPTYDGGVYAALAGEEKFKLITLEHSRGRHHVPHALPQAGLLMRQVRTKTPAMLADEVARWSQQGGYRVFHFLGESTPASQVDGLGYELLARCLRVFYSRSAQVRHLDPGTLRALARSGCCAVGMGLDSGSQRLLEDFYGQDFSVSRAVAVLAGCQDAGLFVSTQWTYPCSQDDRHTREETLRVMALARPQAARFQAAQCIPGSLWALQADHYGFTLDRARHARWVRGLAAEHDTGTALRGWSSGQVRQEQAWMRERMAEVGVVPGLTERHGMLARFAGEAGAEGAWVGAVNEALRTLDVARVAGEVARFNAGATVPVSRIARRPLHAYVAAAGN